MVWLLSVSCLAQDSPAPDRPVKDKWALVVGISKFQDSSINLKYAAKDASDFAKFLVSEANFAPDHVRVLLDEEATRENIISEFGDTWLPRVVQPDDLALIYVSSHGSPSSMDSEGVNYVVAHDTNKERLFATGISMQELTDLIKKRVHSDRVVVILDACHSGSAKTAEKGLVRKANFDAEQVAQGTGQLVICSSSPNQVSWESKHYPNGIFTHFLIESLRKNAKLKTAFDDLTERVQTEVLQDRGELQTPVLKSRWTGSDLVLSAPPSKPRPGLPPSPTIRVKIPPTAATASNAATAISNSTVAKIPPQNAQPGQGFSPPPPAVAPPVVISPPVVAQSNATAVTVNQTGDFQRYASNGFVRMKMLDAEEKMTGYYMTIEIANDTGQPITSSNTKFMFFKDGYTNGGTSGSGVYGGDVSVPPGGRAKLQMSNSQPVDEIQVKFAKPNWSSLTLRLK